MKQIEKVHLSVMNEWISFMSTAYNRMYWIPGDDDEVNL